MRAIVLTGTSNAAALTAVFRPLLSPSVTRCTDGSSAMRRAAQSLRVKNEALVELNPERCCPNCGAMLNSA